MSEKTEYYIQDTRQYVGNSMLWWKKDNLGYSPDIREARVFSCEEALTIVIDASDGSKKMWPKDYIDINTVIEPYTKELPERTS